MFNTITVKKYLNRKLYLVEQSKYITIPNLVNMLLKDNNAMFTAIGPEKQDITKEIIGLCLGPCLLQHGSNEVNELLKFIK